MSVRVQVPTVLQGYTDGAAAVEADGTTVAELLADLDTRHPGLRFRMVDETGRLRPHMRVFINKAPVQGLDARVGADDSVQILQRLSGG